MNTQTIKTKVKDYLFNHAGEQVSDTVDIFETQIVNSLFAITLLAFLEKEFTIKFTMEDMDLNRLRTVDAIALFVTQKLRSA